jgi:hypothetical protein
MAAGSFFKLNYPSARNRQLRGPEIGDLMNGTGAILWECE